MEMQTIGPFEGSASALAAQATDAISRMKGPPALAILYAPLAVAHAPLLAALSAALPCPVVGTTTGGACFTERGHTAKGVVLGLLGGVEVERARVSLTEAGGLERIGAAIDGMTFQPGLHHALMVFANGFLLDGEAFVKALRTHSPRTCQHFGAMGGDDWTFQGPLVFDDGGAHAGSALLVRMSNVNPWHGKAMHGFCALPTARKLTVTQSDGTRILAFDHRPALDVYLEELRRAGIDPGSGPTLRQTMTLYELGMVSVYNPELRVRAPFGADEAAKALLMTACIEEGTQVEVVGASREAMLGAAKALRADVLGRLPSAPAGLLVFDCAARFVLLGEDYRAQVAAFAGGQTTPLLGFASYGEVGRFRGQVEGFHNTTAVMVAAL